MNERMYVAVYFPLIVIRSFCEFLGVFGPVKFIILSLLISVTLLCLYFDVIAHQL